MNSKTKENFISQALIKNAQLFKNVKFLLKMQIVNKRIVILYDTQNFLIAMIDNFEHRKNDYCQFYAVNMRDYNMILKFS